MTNCFSRILAALVERKLYPNELAAPSPHASQVNVLGAKKSSTWFSNIKTHRPRPQADRILVSEEKFVV